MGVTGVPMGRSGVPAGATGASGVPTGRLPENRRFSGAP